MKELDFDCSNAGGDQMVNKIARQMNNGETRTFLCSFCQRNFTLSKIANGDKEITFQDESGEYLEIDAMSVRDFTASCIETLNNSTKPTDMFFATVSDLEY